jgi:hypothetical protein
MLLQLFSPLYPFECLFLACPRSSRSSHSSRSSRAHTLSLLLLLSFMFLQITNYKKKISRLAVDCMPSANESGGVGVGVSSGKVGVGMLKTKEPFCVEVELETFVLLHSILMFVKKGVCRNQKLER